MNSLVLSSLSNEIRLKLIVCLSKGEKNVSELIANCSLSQSAVSQHLEKLRRAHLVVTRRIGKEVYYSLTNRRVAKVSSELLSFIEGENYESRN